MAFRLAPVVDPDARSVALHGVAKGGTILSSADGGRVDRVADAPGGSSGPSSRGPMVLGVVVSVTASLLAIGHVVWPDVRIDAITVGLLVVAVIPWLGR